jgi:hypothetical protein
MNKNILITISVVFSIIIIVILYFFKINHEDKFDFSNVNRIRSNNYSILIKTNKIYKYKKGDFIKLENEIIGIIDSVYIFENHKELRSLILLDRKIPIGSVFQAHIGKLSKYIDIIPKENKAFIQANEIIECQDAQEMVRL